MSRRPVVVVGGGLAGMACAVRLADRGVPVLLLETRRKLGGRATSYTDSRTGLVLDNCQHVVLGCCTNYLDLLERLGALASIRWTREQYWIEAGGRTSVVRPSFLPAPAHFTLSMLGASFLSLADKARIGAACAAMLAADRSSHDGETFGAFLRTHGQSERAISRFWSPVVVSACNLDVDRVSAASAMHVFQEGFLASARAADVGVPSVPLVDLYTTAAALIERAGGGVRLGAAAEEISAHHLLTSDGERIEADAVVCAVPVERVNRLVGDVDKAADPRFSPLERFTHSPILGVHLVLDRPVLETPHAVLVERGTQWLFRKDNAGRMVHAVISGADEWMPLDEAEIVRRVMDDLRACLPLAAAAQVVSARAVKEKLATFAPVPGLERLRPGPVGPSGIILAGDYTATGWPATMEGATRSGYAAAAAVLGEPAAAVVVPPLRPAWHLSAIGFRPSVPTDGNGVHRAEATRPLPSGPVTRAGQGV